MVAEQGRPSPDIALLQERGGLTPAHWKTILWALPIFTLLTLRFHDQVMRKISDYAKRYGIPGLDENGHHREYLGRRHWDYIAQLDAKYHVSTQRSFPFLGITRINPQLPQEVREFAQAESAETYTLDDFLSSEHDSNATLNTIMFNDSGYNRVLGKTLLQWRMMRYWEYSESKPENDEWAVVEGPIMSRLATANEILAQWLLKEGEIKNPLYTAPKQLTTRIIALAKEEPQEVRERLRAKTSYLTLLHDSLHFGILEKEIENISIRH